MPRRLTAFDASLLYAEGATTPTHVGSVAVFGRPRAGFDYDTLVDLIERRLSMVPRYRQRIAEVPVHLARPVWVDDENFDVTYHVRRAALPAPGSPQQLAELVATLMARRLDRSRPLWEAYLVEGLAGDRFAVLTKSHNALVTGPDAPELGQAILDDGPTPEHTADELWMPRPMPGPARLLAGAVHDAVSVDPLHLLGTVLTGIDGAVAATRAALNPAPRSALNVRISTQRRFAVAATELAKYRKIRAAQGCSVNDVVLTVIAGALRTWLLSRRAAVPEGSSLRALVPLSEGAADGSTVTPHLVDLPIGEPNPAIRLRHIAHQLRHRHGVAARVLMRAGGLAPPTLHALGARAASGFARHVFNLVVTNVPGPQVPRYLGGARMAETFPVVPLVRNQALAIGVSSYDGSVYYGCNADRFALSDVDNVARMIEEALEELSETVSG